MTKNAIEIGTRFHTSFERAYRREQIRGRAAIIVWLLVSGGLVPFISTPGDLVMGLILSVLSFLAILTHWSREAVRYRAYKSSDI